MMASDSDTGNIKISGHWKRPDSQTNSFDDYSVESEHSNSTHSTNAEFKKETPEPSEDHDTPSEQQPPNIESAADRAKNLKKYLIFALSEWITILSKPTVIFVLQMLFFKPAYLCFAIVSLSFILGYFQFNIIWIVGIAITGNVLANKIYRVLEYNALQHHQDAGNSREQMFPDKESAVWINNMIKIIFEQHHTYISQLVLRFLNPIIEELCVVPPVKNIKFKNLELGCSYPQISSCAVKPDAKYELLIFDFDVDYPSDFHGELILTLPFLPDIVITVSQLIFKCRLRFTIQMLQEEFPFVKSCQFSFLERPEIDISIEAMGLPDFLVIPFITEHYVELIRDYLYHQFGAPKYVEVDFSKFVSDEGDAGQCFVADVRSHITDAVRRGSTTEEIPAPMTNSGGYLRKAMKMLTPIRSSKAEVPVPKEASDRKMKRESRHHRRSASSSTDQLQQIVTNNQQEDGHGRSLKDNSTQKVPKFINKVIPLKGSGIRVSSNSTVPPLNELEESSDEKSQKFWRRSKRKTGKRRSQSLEELAIAELTNLSIDITNTKSTDANRGAHEI